MTVRFVVRKTILALRLFTIWVALPLIQFVKQVGRYLLAWNKARAARCKAENDSVSEQE